MRTCLATCGIVTFVVHSMSWIRYLVKYLGRGGGEAGTECLAGSWIVRISIEMIVIVIVVVMIVILLLLLLSYMHRHSKCGDRRDLCPGVSFMISDLSIKVSFLESCPRRTLKLEA